MLNEGNIKLIALPGWDAIADITAPTTTELSDVGAIDLSTLVMVQGYQFGAAADDKVDEKALSDEGNAQAPGNSNYVATGTFFRMADTVDDKAWAAFTEKNLEFTLVERRGSKWSTDFAAADNVKVMRVLTTTPQDASIEGVFTKFVEEFLPQEAELRAVVAAGA
jgi:hypothetical protein